MEDKTGTTTYGYDKLNRQTSKTSPGVATAFTQTYDAEGNTLTYTDAQGTVTYGYNAANQLTSLAEPGGSCTGTVTKCTTFGNDDNGRRTTTTYPGGTVMTTTYDASGRATRVRTVNGIDVLTDLQYSYTSGTSDRSVVQTRTDVNAGAVFTYGYDSSNRLTSAREAVSGSTAAAWTYCYDASGNRTNVSTSTTNGASCTTAPTTSYGYNNADELTSKNGSTTGWTYDANGNETAGNSTVPRSSGAYNALDQLTSLTTAGTASAFAYAGEDNRERTTAGGTSFQNGPLGVTADTTTGTTRAVTRDPDGQLVSLRAGGSSYYYLFDNQDSVLGLVAATGARVNTYSYDPYGASRVTNEIIANPYRYISGYFDNATGLTKLGYRYYDPNLGRFTQTDPTSSEANSYLYGAANPVNYTDPDGDFALALAAGFAVPGLGQALAVAVGVAVVGYVAYKAGSAVIAYSKEHSKNARPSTENQHQKANTRRQRDQAGEKKEKAGRYKPNPNKRRKSK
jgi:RHS repeat-associated protein